MATGAGPGDGSSRGSPWSRPGRFLKQWTTVNPSVDPVTAIPFNNQYTALGEGFFVRTRPSPVSGPRMVCFNRDLARDLGMDVDLLDSDYGAVVFAGNEIPDGAEPLAMAYAGHQFGFFSPQLGDGRALLLGEVVGRDGMGYGIQLKGSGRTVFSRNGDGRAPLGPVLREYLVSEAMHRLGVPTTRALAVVATGDSVLRERALPGGIITRVAGSFVRVGTFEFYARRGDIESVRELADHVIRRNYPGLAGTERPYLALLEKVIDRQAALIARWMQLGFIHGVMNTDNMSVAGETIDYGPCAFMDHFSFHQVYSSIDRQGRYAYSNQPYIALWNLARLAECLALILDDDREKAVELATEALGQFLPGYEKAWLRGMRAKCGLFETPGEAGEDGRKLVGDLLDLMANGRADHTLTFFHLSSLNRSAGPEDEAFVGQFGTPGPAREWLAQWRTSLRGQPLDDRQRQDRMRRVNPLYIPRNHLVEAAIRAAEDAGDFSVFHALHAVLRNPYERQPGKEYYQQPPAPEEVVLETFCGT